MPDQLERLKAARNKVAQLVLIDRVYLPIFERLESEIGARELEDEMIERAKELVRGVRPDQPRLTQRHTVHSKGGYMVTKGPVSH